VQELIALADAFVAEVGQHFRDEEAIITAAGYPHVLEHAGLHHALLEKATAMAKRVRAGDVSVIDLFQFLAHDLVARHLLIADREFFPCLES
jgi:hemerythrin-like metal-binding protein